MRHLLLLLCLLVPCALAAQVSGEMRPGINFPGADIGSSFVGDNNPTTCMTICTLTADCEAWTYVKPGIQGPEAMCWVKTEVAAVEVSECCISGTLAAPPASPVGEFFPLPLVGTHEVSACLSDGTDCGQPAADFFCQSWGYARASEFRQVVTDDSYSILSQRICSDNCLALRDVSCAPK